MNNIFQITLSAILALTASGTFAADKVRVGYLAEPAHGLHFIAREKGFFAEEGIDADLFQFNTTAEGCAAVRAKKLDVGTFGTAAPLLFTGDVIFRGALKKAGVDPYKDLKIIEFGGQGAVVEAVRKGAVDAGIVFSPHFSLAKKNYGLVVSNYIADFQPAYTCCRLIANTKDLKAKREIYKRYLVAEIRAYRFYRENQEETVKIFAGSFKLDPGIVRADTYTDHTFDSNPDPLKKGTVDFWNTMNEIGYLPENRVDISRHIDTSIYREALDEVLKRWPDDPVYREMDAFFKANN